MTDKLEAELRRLFNEDADTSPLPHPLAEGAREVANRHRRIRWASIVTGVAAASVIGIVAAATLNQPDHLSTESLPPNGGAAACARYSPELVAGRAAFAFDGTVTAIGAGQPNPDSPFQQLVPTSFSVHRWYKGGTGETVTVQVPVGSSEDPLPPSYQIGTRLLVSGFEDTGREAEHGLVAWGCGYTSYYDPATASSWAACAGYSPDLIAGRHAFAFDGTVTAIGPSHIDPHKPPLSLVSTTFRIRHWYDGGTSHTATVDIPVGSMRDDPLSTGYHVGSRLLVSGYEGSDADAEQGLVAWGCGYTRYYDPATASSWAAALG